MAFLCTLAVLGLAVPYRVPLLAPCAVLLGLGLASRGRLACRHPLDAGLLALAALGYLWGLVIDQVVGPAGATWLCVGESLNIGVCALAYAAVSAWGPAHVARWRLQTLRLLAWTLPAVALAGLAKAAGLARGTPLAVGLDGPEGTPLGTSLLPDYNMAALALIAGLLACHWQWRRARTLGSALGWLLALLACALAVLGSGSRRGLLVLSLLALLALGRGLWGLGRALHQLARGRLATATLRHALALGLLGAMLGGLSGRLGPQAATALDPRLLDRLESRRLAGAPQSRLPLWAEAWEAIGDAPLPAMLVGGGLGYLADGHPHQAVLAAGRYSGLLGATVVALLLARLAWRWSTALPPLSGHLWLLSGAVGAFLSVSGHSLWANSVVALLLPVLLAAPRLTSPSKTP